MSAVEFGLTLQPFINALSQMPFEQPFSGSETLAARCEALSHLSRSVASMSPEILSRNLVALLRPLFVCDSANIVIFNKGANDAPWTLIGEEHLAALDTPIEESTVWPVYQEQKALWIEDWKEDERLAVRKEAEDAAAVGYRSLCRLPLSTSDGCLGVLSLANSRPQQLLRTRSPAVVAGSGSGRSGPGK